MKTVLLTTDTPHHTYFVWCVAERFSWKRVVLETEIATPPFETRHPFEDERDAYEREVLLADCPGSISTFAPTCTFASVNSKECLDTLRADQPDVLLVFGTRRLDPDILGVAPVALNLHGGDPEAYRGLDTHLWALYHRDYGALVTTLHHLDAGIDTGPMVERVALKIQAGSLISMLRAINTKCCVDLVLRALERLGRGEPLPAHPLRTRGRYYSFMPSVLKGICVRHFESRFGPS